MEKAINSSKYINTKVTPHLLTLRLEVKSISTVTGLLDLFRATLCDQTDSTYFPASARPEGRIRAVLKENQA